MRELEEDRKNERVGEGREKEGEEEIKGRGRRRERIIEKPAQAFGL